MTRAPSFVVPQFVIGPLQLLIHGRFGEFFGLIKLGHDGACGLGKFFIVEIDEIIGLAVKAGDQPGGMTVAADVLHALAPLLPGQYLDHLALLAVLSFLFVAHLRQRRALGHVRSGLVG